MTDRMWFHSVDYTKDRQGTRGFNRGWWINGTPRLSPPCRLRGHRPVVDGVDIGARIGGGGVRRPAQRARWACCDRCGVRLQQPVDSDLEIGQPYTHPLPTAPIGRGVVGGQVMIGGAHPGAGFEVKVGNAGSEHTLAVHLHLGRLLFLAVHTEAHGTWLQRRLNPTGYQSRVTGLSLSHGRVSWRVWAKRDEYSSSDPWWMSGSVRSNPLDVLFGPLRYEYTDVGGPVDAVVRMPQGDDHAVILQLRRRSRGRARLRRRRLGWTVDWSIPRGDPGIVVETGRSGYLGSGVDIADTTDPAAGNWVGEACGAIAGRYSADRARRGYRPPIGAAAES